MSQADLELMHDISECSILRTLCAACHMSHVISPRLVCTYYVHLYLDTRNSGTDRSYYIHSTGMAIVAVLYSCELYTYQLKVTGLVKFTDSHHSDVHHSTDMC